MYHHEGEAETLPLCIKFNSTFRNRYLTSSVTKPAKMETGLIVNVPPFINEGEKIRIDTAEGTYMSRA